MDELQYQAMREIHEALVKSIETPAVTAKLFQYGVFSLDTKSIIDANTTTHDKNTCLLEHVYRSDNPETFDLVVKALKKPNPFLSRRLADGLHKQCVQQLIHELVAEDGSHDSSSGDASRQPTEHSEFNGDETLVKRLFSLPVGNSESNDMATPLTRDTQSVRMRHRRSSRCAISLYRQRAIDRISRERLSRGEQPLSEENLDGHTLKVELGLFEVKMRVRVSDTSSAYSSSRGSAESNPDEQVVGVETWLLNDHRGGRQVNSGNIEENGHALDNTEESAVNSRYSTSV